MFSCHFLELGEMWTSVCAPVLTEWQQFKIARDYTQLDQHRPIKQHLCRIQTVASYIKDIGAQEKLQFSGR